jgi:hypothetical protein
MKVSGFFVEFGGYKLGKIERKKLEKDQFQSL